jgi:hypothetical protein
MEAGVPLGRGAALDLSFDDFIRTTSRVTGRRPELAQIAFDKGDIYEGVSRGVVLRFVRGVQAGEGSRRRQVSAASDADAGWIREKNYFFRLSKYRERWFSAFRRSTRRSCSLTFRRNEICGCSEPARGHFDEPRGQLWAHPAAVCADNVVYVWFDALINLRRGGRIRDRRGQVSRMVAGEPPHHRQGHHPFSYRGLAGHADERGAADTEQVFGHGG